MSEKRKQEIAILTETKESFKFVRFSNPNITFLFARVEEYGDIEGDTPEEQEKNMMAEIYHRGPISCGIAVTE